MKRTQYPAIGMHIHADFLGAHIERLEAAGHSATGGAVVMKFELHLGCIVGKGNEPTAIIIMIFF